MSTVKEPMKRKEHEKVLRKLQVEPCALQDWVKQQGLRVVVLNRQGDRSNPEPP
jgi:polyphosphate kinase 2 (PPK2 family)